MRSAKPSPNPQEAGSHGSCGPAAGVTLEIGRGRTEHRKRPVESPRFLIGSSARCDLCLGGVEIPPLHSMICTNGAEVWLEAMSDSPELLVNGRPEKSVRLKDQDRVRIEPFELIVHLPANTSVASARFAPSETQQSAEQESKSPEPSELSALELVERIEAATQLVNDFEQRNRLGMESLLSAVQERGNRMLAGAPSTPRGTVLPMSAVSAEANHLELADLESLVGHISDVVSELEKRSGFQWRREAGYRDAVSSLFETQDRLSRQLEILLRRVASLNTEQAAPERGRAIA
ncbi:MAG TPA: FHA domain-containing protein [Planctomycetaceae bacterium]|nr:FHA domain-containing protein [Planctomycetaceae bacterium]